MEEREEAWKAIAAIFGITIMQSVAMLSGLGGEFYIYSLGAICILGGISIGRYMEMKNAHKKDN